MNNREAAEKEWQEAKAWASAEEEKVKKALSEKNAFLGGLDTNNKSYSYIYEELKRRIKAIQAKYAAT